MTTPFLGVLRIEHDFARPAGDSANQGSFDMPIKIRALKNSTVQDVVHNSNNYPQEFIQGWVSLIQELKDEGAVAVITSCGFLSAIHPILREKFPNFPIGTSALLQIPIANNLVQLGTRVGVITFEGSVLGEKHFKGVGADPNTPVVGIKKGCSFDRLIRNCVPYNFKEHTKDVVEAAQELVTTYDNIGGIVLECANMGPFRKAVREATKLPVWDIVTLGNFVYDVGLSRSFDTEASL